MTENNKITLLSRGSWPPLLREIPDPPKKLFLRGTLPKEGVSFLAVVGSRNYSPYGQRVCEDLIRGLSGFPVAIVSGLAFGIDGIAHKTALQCGLTTIAVPGSGLDDTALYPRAHFGLARDIIVGGGALLSEYAPDFKATDWSFPQRNRIMAGMSSATLIIEAGEKSGTLITARLAMEYNRDVLVVPGPITSPFCRGSNELLRQGAQAVTKAEDILDALRIRHDIPEEHRTLFDALTPEEQKIMRALEAPKSRDELTHETGLSPQDISILISKLEIEGAVRQVFGKIERA